ncbi:MAG: DUF448 domain-containing protein [candidate division NC10 bacterium]|nr:DUF448 domain-containing protein [candidate division NC10 bacterium]
MKAKEVLIRFYASPGGSLGIDLTGKGGRGAYLCPRRSCLELTLKRKGFQHALGVDLKLPMEETILEAMRTEVVKKIVSLLGLACRARRLAVGSPAAEGTLRGGAARLLLLAKDAEGSSFATLRAEAEKQGTPILTLLTKAQLAQALGRVSQVVVVKDPHFACGILHYVEKVPEGKA